MSKELRMEILRLLDERHKADSSHAITDAYVAEKLGIELPEIQRQMDILQDDGLTRPANSHDGRRAWISPRGIKALESGPHVPPTTSSAGTASSGLKLFISHSSRDRMIAAAVVDLLRSALALSAVDIRCTSVDGYRLAVGTDTDDQLRREILDARGFIGIVSEASISSAYVLFELGARWGAKLHLAPILAPGAPVTLLRGPLAGLTALRCDDENQLHQLVGDIGSLLGIASQPVGAYRPALLGVLQTESAPAVEQASKSKAVALTALQETAVKAIISLDADYVYVGNLADNLRWNVLFTQAIVDQLYDLLPRLWANTMRCTACQPKGGPLS